MFNKVRRLALIAANAAMLGLPQVAYATGSSEPRLPDEFQQSQFSAQTFLDGLSNGLRWFAGFAALAIVGALIYMGYKLATSAGNYQKRAQVMEGIPYIILGGILAFGSWIVANGIQKFVEWLFTGAPIR